MVESIRKGTSHIGFGWRKRLPQRAVQLAVGWRDQRHPLGDLRRFGGGPQRQAGVTDDHRLAVDENLVKGLDRQAMDLFNFRLSFHLAGLLSARFFPFILTLPAIWHNYS